MSTLTVAFLLAGAEPEELVTAVAAAARGQGGVALGNALGANATLLTLVMGLIALIRPVSVGGRVRTYALLASAAAAAASFAVLPSRVGRLGGFALVVCYAVLVGLLWLGERRVPAVGEARMVGEDDDDKSPAPSLGLLLAVVGILVMAAGGWFASAGAERLVSALGLTDSSVGLTFVALATTGEFVALVWAATRAAVGELAVAAVFGSVIYNATVTLGAAAVIRPVATNGAVGFALIGVLGPIVILLLAGRRGLLGRPAGACLVIAYIAFVVVALS